MVKIFRLPEFDYEVEVGAKAQQADGSVWFKQGGTVLLSTAVSKKTKEFPGFLPLTIEYRELFSAAGKIPGGYFKREGRLSEREILTSRLIDRAIRPLFPEHYFNDTQVLDTVYSVDKIHAPGILALNATSLALCISKIPFLGPVGAIEVARVDGKWIFNPTYPQMEASDVRMIIAGTEEGVNMVEGSTNEISETEFVDVMFQAHDRIKKLVAWQKEIVAEIGKEKEAENSDYDWAEWERRVNSFLTDDKVKQMYIADKVERSSYLSEIKKEFIDKYQDQITEDELSTKLLDYIFDQQLKKKLTELIFVLNKRIDGRDFTTVRTIKTEVGLLPFTHGSALFSRGRTQALVTVTLGGGKDEQRIESVMVDEEQTRKFMLHYNFPPFSVGEVRPVRGPGRREIGHGALAASALKNMLPKKEEFPYTIRIVADMLESDGSTSMATVCGSTMALMNAGVPLKKMVAGVAMGLVRSEKGEFHILSDITGFEDAFGLMDFKVTGTKDGITAIQMDVKYKGGLSREIFEAAFAQSKQGRMYILGEMQKVMSEPNPALSELVPKLKTVKIPVDKIGAIIGSGGKTIREIMEKTSTNIDIENDGLVKIFAAPGGDLDAAIDWVKTLAGLIEKGAIYKGKIRRLVDFGMFVELVPGVDGLIHISAIPKHMQRNLAQEFQLDDPLTVEVVDYDPSTGRIRLGIKE